MPINLSKSATTLNNIEYWGNDNPVCPFCDKVIDTVKYELFELYNEDVDHSIDCPFCGKEVRITTEIKYKFSTDNQSKE